MAKRKVHMRDIVLGANAGIRFPMCYANAPLLDTDKGHLPISGELSEVTCKHCQRLFRKRYPWASGK